MITIDAKPDRVHISVENSSNGQPIENPFTGTLGSIRRRLQFFFDKAEITINTVNKKTSVVVVYGRLK